MFNQITIHRGVTRNEFDFGLLAETLLFYSDVLLLLDRGSLASLIEHLDADLIVRLVEEFGLKLSYHREAFATLTNSNNGLAVHNFSEFKIGGQNGKRIRDVHEEIEDVVLRKLGSTRGTRKLARILTEKISKHVLKTQDCLALRDAARNDLKDLRYLRFAVETAISALAPSATLDPNWSFGIIDLGEEGFIVNTNIDFGKLSARYKIVPGQENGTLTAVLIMTYVFGARADAYFAGSYMSGYVCDPLSSAFMKRRFLDLVRRRERDANEIDLFQELKLPDGKKIREVINSGEARFVDIFPVLSAARKFKGWLATCNPDETLMNEYFEAVSKQSWLQKLPGKTIRWITAASLGVTMGAVFSPLEGALASFGLGALDTFLVDRLLKGWRPDQFVEGSLTNFIEGKR